MGISNLAVKRPVTTTMAVFIIIAFGALSILNINLDMMPNMDIPVAIVMTTYTGAGPEEVEKLITEPLEGVLGTTPGVKEITSTSSTGNSTVVLEFEDGTNIDNAALDMRERVDMIKAALPDDASDPRVMKIDINSMTSMTIGVTSKNGDLVGLKNTVEEKVVNRLERQDGVASVSVSGGKDNEIEVVLKEEKLRGYGVTESTILQLLRSENSNSSTGSVKEGERTLSLRVLGEFESLEQIRNLPVTTPTGTVIYLRDIADVNEVYKENTSLAFINGSSSVTLTIQKQSTANTVKVSDAILKEISYLQEEMPNYKFTVLMDPGKYIRVSIGTVLNSALQGGILAAVILYVFLRNFRSTLIVAVAMPISIVATFILMYYTNMTINTMSLGGLTLGIGMLVDNSIVVLESIFRKIEEGIERKKAAVDGAREVANSVVASTITTIAVFLPISFTGGMTAQIFNQLSMTIAFSLLSSLLISLTFVPVACSILLSVDDVKGVHKRNHIGIKILDFFANALKSLENIYKKVLAFCLRRRKLTFLVVVIFIVLTTLSLGFIGMEFMPATDEGIVSINVSMPKGTLMEETEATAFKVVDTIQDYPEVDNTTIQIGGGGMGGARGTDSASITVNLLSKSERTRSSIDVASAMEKDLKNIAGAEITAASSSNSMGRFGGGGGVSITVKGDELDTLTEITEDLKQLFSQIKGVSEATTSLEDTTPQATIKIDRVKASAYGVNSSSVASIVNTAVSGSVATAYKIDGDEFDIRVRQDKGNFDYITDIKNILIPTTKGASIPLYEIADIVRDEIPVAINRENQQKYVGVSVSLEKEASTGEITTAITNIMKGYILPPNYTWEFTGSAQQMNETFFNLGLALIIAILLLYMIMAAEFESFIYPIIVMCSMPIAFSGGLFGLFVTGESLSITGFLGLIMLAGIVINNAIVLIDYTNLLVREHGMSVIDALTTAAPIRLRPILMSTLTTALALIPMILATDEGSELMKALAVVVVFGLMFSTLITLLFIPTVYLVFNNWKIRFRNFRHLLFKKQAVVSND